MCIHERLIHLPCGHERWGSILRRCEQQEVRDEWISKLLAQELLRAKGRVDTSGETVLESAPPPACQIKKAHPYKTLRIHRCCSECRGPITALDIRIGMIKEGLRRARGDLEAAKKKRAARVASANSNPGDVGEFPDINALTSAMANTVDSSDGLDQISGTLNDHIAESSQPSRNKESESTDKAQIAVKETRDTKRISQIPRKPVSCCKALHPLSASLHASSSTVNRYIDSLSPPGESSFVDPERPATPPTCDILHGNENENDYTTEPPIWEYRGQSYGGISGLTWHSKDRPMIPGPYFVRNKSDEFDEVLAEELQEGDIFYVLSKKYVKKRLIKNRLEAFSGYDASISNFSGDTDLEDDLTMPSTPTSKNVVHLPVIDPMVKTKYTTCKNAQSSASSSTDIPESLAELINAAIKFSEAPLASQDSSEDFGKGHI